MKSKELNFITIITNVYCCYLYVCINQKIGLISYELRTTCYLIKLIVTDATTPLCTIIIASEIKHIRGDNNVYSVYQFTVFISGHT